MTIYLKTNLLCVFGSLVLVQRWPDIRERMNQKGKKKKMLLVFQGPLFLPPSFTYLSVLVTLV